MSTIDKWTKFVNSFLVTTKEENIVAAAFHVFMRYGFKRTTMGDIATAAKMSRPALYLIFPSKEEIFKAALESASSRTLAEIRLNIGNHPTPFAQIMYAFEVWTIRAFDQIQASPDAKDLLESGYEIANDVLTRGFSEFESVIGQVLKPLVKAQKELKLSPDRIAKILTGAVHGLKQNAADSEQLRQAIKDLLMITLGSLQSRPKGES